MIQNQKIYQKRWIDTLKTKNFCKAIILQLKNKFKKFYKSKKKKKTKQSQKKLKNWGKYLHLISQRAIILPKYELL